MRRTLSGLQWWLVGIVALAAVLAGFAAFKWFDGGPTPDVLDPRVRDAGRILDAVNVAISDPRQDSAAGYARAAAATEAGQDGRLTVLDATDLPSGGADPASAFARLVYWIHFDAVRDVWIDRPVLNRCYEQQYNRYGATGARNTVACPSDPVPLEVPPAPPVPHIPQGIDRLVERVLRTASSGGQVEGALRERIARLGAAAPQLTVAEADGAIGVSLRGGPGECLLVSKVGTEVSSWYLSRVQAMPGEVACEPATALHPEVVPSTH